MKNRPIRHILKRLISVIGIVLVWRGVWYLLDYIDRTYFNGGHALTAIAGILIGSIILYIIDKEITIV